MEGELAQTSCVIWQVRSQLLGRCRLNVFVSCGTFVSREFKPRQSGDMVCVRGPLGAQMSTPDITKSTKGDRFCTKGGPSWFL
jgi:hypothetical protein